MTLCTILIVSKSERGENKISKWITIHFSELQFINWSGFSLSLSLSRSQFIAASLTLYFPLSCSSSCRTCFCCRIRLIWFECQLIQTSDAFYYESCQICFFFLLFSSFFSIYEYLGFLFKLRRVKYKVKSCVFIKIN